jgi:acetyltransferase-like isoleucine patch superfamily enzyme
MSPSTSAFDTPWKITNRLLAALVHPFVRIQFALNGIPWNAGWRFYGMPIIQKHRLSKMTFGPRLQLRSTVRSNPLGPNHAVILVTWEEGACLEVGENFAMTGGTLCAAQRITIGDNVTVGANAIIADTDFHPLDAAARKVEDSGGESAPVVIEDDVFIGMNCLVMKGVTIGAGSIIGAGSVVTRDIPPHVIAAGNPARIIREYEPA